MEGQQKQQASATTAAAPTTTRSLPGTTTQAKIERREFVDVLPKDLQTIIAEVAKSGVCLKFPWVEDAKSAENQYAVPKQIPRIPRKKHPATKFPPSSTGIVRHKRSRPNGRLGHASNMARMLPFHQTMGSSTSTTTTVNMATGATPLTHAGKGTTLLPPRIMQHPQQGTVTQMATGRRLGDNGRKRSISRSSSGLPSGSEAEDLSQYECDSESTSVTSVSELSFDLGRGSRDHWSSSGVGSMRKPEIERLEDSHVHVFVGQPKPRSLRDAFRIAVDLLLESYYQKRGYKPSPAEKRKHSTAIANEAKIVRGDRAPEGRSLSRQSSVLSERELMMQESIISFDGGANPIALSDDELQKLQKTAFCNRKEKILSFLDDPLSTDPVSRGQPLAQNREPPFTLQRIAEILEDPERYYTQTHKLCNSLEKLLLVSTTVTDFGGWYGGDEESIRTILEIPRHRSSSVSKMGGRDQQESPTSIKAVVHSNPLKLGTKSDEEEGESPRPVYDAAARASLRAKFDHTGFDPHLIGAAKAIPDGRSSPPPPNRASSPPIQIPVVTGFLRSHSPQGSPTAPDGRFPSAFSFHNAATQSRASAVQLSGSPNSASSSAVCSAFTPTTVPMQQQLQLSHAAAISSLATHEVDSNNAQSGGTEQPGRDAETESKSPASLSDADDSDMSYDDSASDRSDGSDSGQPDTTTASLAATLHRAHQRLHQQNRVLSQLHGETFAERVGLLQPVTRNAPDDSKKDGNDSGGKEE